MASPMFQPAQGFQPAGGFGLQMPQIGFQPLQQPSIQAQPLQFQPPQIPGFEPMAPMQSQFGQPASDPTTFTIGIPGGFQFVPDAANAPYSPSAGGASPAYREGTVGLRTRDAGLATKKPKKKICGCC